MSSKGQAMNKIMEASVIIPFSISTATFLGMTIKEWVLVLTLILLCIQISFWMFRIGRGLYRLFYDKGIKKE
jgi:hypothetical protein